MKRSPLSLKYKELCSFEGRNFTYFTWCWRSVNLSLLQIYQKLAVYLTDWGKWGKGTEPSWKQTLNLFFFKSCTEGRTHEFFPLWPLSSQSTVGKKMADVHFTTITCEPNTTCKVKESHVFEKFVPVLSTLCMLGFKIFELFLYVFMMVVLKILCSKSYG